MKFILVLSCLLIAVNAGSSLHQSRIINGTVASQGQFPYQVSLRRDKLPWCGASILDEYTLLSAAHCVYSFDTNVLLVALGNTAISEQKIFHEVASYKVHPDYNYTNIAKEVSNDVSIIKLKTPIVFHTGVRPIKLRQSDIGIEDVISSGWGALMNPGYPSDRLRFVKLKTLTTAECQGNNESHIYDTELCTFSRVGQGICAGDSGGPLVDINGEQVGITSWIRPPCGGGYPDVHTRVYSFLDWIETNRY